MNCGSPIGLRRGKGSTGAVLAIALVLALVLFILSSGLFMLFSTNVKSYDYTSGRIRARVAAESGVNLALHILADEDGAPVGEPYSLPGDSAQWISIPGEEDMTWVVIDPFDINSVENTIGGVEIRSRGLSGGYTRDIVVHASPDYSSRYALCMDRQINSGFLSDGRFIEGPVHSNGRVEFSSISPDSSGDPYLGAVSTAMDEFYFAGSGSSRLPHPDGSNVWVRPYSRHVQGEPSWKPGADSISFSSMGDWFASLRSQAASGGILLSNVQRILIDGGNLYCRAGLEYPTDTVSILESDLVFVQGGARPVYIKSLSPPVRPFTLVSNGPVYIAGSIDGMSMGREAPMGLVSMGDIVVARDPALYGEEDWPNPWKIDTDSNIELHCCLAAPRGSLRAQDPARPDDEMRLTVYGGLIQKKMGILGLSGRGYNLQIVWDNVLTSMHPPYFPPLPRWVMSSWQQDPDYGDRTIEENMI